MGAVVLWKIHLLEYAFVMNRRRELENLKVLNMIKGINKLKALPKHIPCE